MHKGHEIEENYHQPKMLSIVEQILLVSTLENV